MASRSPNTERSSWLTHEGYVASFREQASRLSTIARTGAPDAAVPTCPGWTVLDLVRHVVQVYAHKAALLRAGEAVPGNRVSAAADMSLMPALERHDAVVEDLANLLLDLEPAAPAWTWMEGAGESTAGAWARRMAHEALIHRVDAELATGSHVAPAADDLAIDGVNEVLTWMASDPDVVASDEGSVGAPGSVIVDYGRGAWVVTVGDSHQVVVPGDAATTGDARVVGSPFELDLSMWGRPSGAQWTGSAAVVERLRARIGAAA